MLKNFGKRTIRSFILSGCKVLVSLISLGTLMLLSRFLDLERYGNFRQFLFLGGLLSPLLLLGSPQSIPFFLPTYTNKAKQFILISVLIQVLLLILFSSVFYFARDQIFAYYANYDLSEFIFTIWFWALLSSLLQLLSSVLIAIEKPILSGAFLALNSLIIFTGVCLFLNGNINYIYGIYPISCGFTAVFAAAYLIYKLNDKINFKSFISDFSDYLKFTIPIFCSQYIGSFGRKISSLMVVPFLSSGGFAVFANGAFEVPFISIIASSAVAVITPEFVRLFKEEKIHQALGLWSRASLKTSIATFPLFAFLFIEAENVLILLFSEAYIESVPTFRSFLLLLPIQAVYFGLIYVASNNPKILLYRSIGTTLFSLFFTYLICLFWDPMLAPLGLVVAIYGWAFPYNLYFFKKITGSSILEYLKVPKFINIACKAFIATLPLFLLKSFDFTPLYQIIVGFASFSLLYLFLIKQLNHGPNKIF